MSEAVSRNGLDEVIPNVARMVRDRPDLPASATRSITAQRRFIRVVALIPLALIALFSAAWAQEPFPASELHLSAIFATRPDNKAVYCLLCSGFFRAARSGEEDAIIKAFAADHPRAQALPVTLTVPSVSSVGPRVPMIFVWIEDGDANLNVKLVREGAFAGSVMIDAVQIASRGVAQPDEKERPQRWIDNARYEAFLQRVKAAEAAAKAQRKGIWSDEYRKQFGDPEQP